MEPSIESTYKTLLIIGAIITPVAWFIRLEAKVLYMEKSRDDERSAHEKSTDKTYEDIKQLNEKITIVLQKLGNIEGQLKHINKD